MKYGCNYSEPLMELLREEKIEIDYIKIGAFGPFLDVIETASTYKPLLIHGFGWFEHAGAFIESEEQYAHMVERLTHFKVPYLGIHCASYAKDLQVHGLGEHDDVSKVFKSIWLMHMSEVVKAYQANLPCPIVLENIDYNPHYERGTTVPFVVVPKWISKLCEQTGAGFLLDLSHAKVSAYHLGMDVKAYLEQLPLEQLVEIHLSGTHLDSEMGIIDVHDQLMEEDYELFKWVLEKKMPQVVTLEYGWPGEEYAWRTKKEAIVEQLVKIQAIVREVEL